MRAIPALAALLLLVVPACAGTFPAAPLDPAVQDALGYLRSQQHGDGSIGSLSVTAWVVMAIAAAGEDPNAWQAPGSTFSPVDYLERSSHRLVLLTDFERQLLAATAAGHDPTTFGGVDLVAQVRAAFLGGQFGSQAALNDDAFAILSLRSAGADPADAQLASSAAFIASHQNADGGWSYQVGLPSSVDDTAAAVMALLEAGTPASSPAVQAALSFLHAQQLPDASFSSLAHGGTAGNTASTAWAVQALAAAGEDPSGPSWTTSLGVDAVDALRAFQDADGSFHWDGVQRVGPIWMTAYAVPALLGDPYPVA